MLTMYIYRMTCFAHGVVFLDGDDCTCVKTFSDVNYGRPISYFRPVVSSFFFLSFFSSPNLSHRRLDVYHTCTHGVALVRI